jgi:hypothetical protein
MSTWVLLQGMKAIVVVLVFVVAFGSMESDAMTVYFGDANRAPSNTLQIGGVTVTGSYSEAPDQPSTVMGSGLGGAALGPDDSVDWSAKYSANEETPDDGYGTDEHLSLTVDGSFTSITIVPHFPVVVETGAPVDSEFAWFGVTVNWQANLGEAIPLFYPTNASPITIPITPYFPGSTVNTLTIGPDFESSGAYPQEFQTLMGYRAEYLSEAQTIQMGFTIQSVNYTTIPEPNPTLLVSVGLVALLCVRRKLTSENNLDPIQLNSLVSTNSREHTHYQKA